MNEKIHLKILLKKWMLVGFLMNQGLMGADINDVSNYKIIKKNNFCEISNFDPNQPNTTHSPLHTLFIRISGHNEFKPYQIYTVSIKDISWDTFYTNKFHVNFFDETKTSYLIARVDYYRNKIDLIERSQ